MAMPTASANRTVLVNGSAVASRTPSSGSSALTTRPSATSSACRTDHAARGPGHDRHLRPAGPGDRVRQRPARHGHWEMLAEGYEPFQTDLKNLTSPSSPTR